MGRLRRLGAALLSIIDTRLRLFSLEFQGEKLRLLDTLLQLAVALSFGFVALFLGTLTLAIFVWDRARYSGLLLMTGFFLGAAAFLLWRLRQSLRKAPAPFSKTLKELDKDRECLTGKD
jgi:uncharacterized membrane protein YqjE